MSFFAIDDLSLTEPKSSTLTMSPSRVPQRKRLSGLRVAVDEPLPVRGVEPDGDLTQHAHDAFGRKAFFALDERAKLFALEILHDERVALVVRLLEVPHVDDVLVRQELGDFVLALEPFDGDRVARHVGVEHLDGDPRLVLHVERLVDAPHAAVGHDAPNLVAHAKHRRRGAGRRRWTATGTSVERLSSTPSSGQKPASSG